MRPWTEFSSTRGPLLIALLYLALAGAWILFSDRILHGIVPDPELLGTLQTIKGGVFVLVTAAGLYLFIRAVEKPLRKSRERFLRVVANVPDGMLLCGQSLKLRYVNEALGRMVGQSPEQAAGRHAGEALPRDLYNAFLPLFEQSLEQSRSVSGEYEIALPGGRTRTLVLISIPIGEGKGAVHEVLCILRDITEARSREREYRELLNGMHETVFVISFQGSILDVNDTALRVLGYSRQEMLSMSPADLDPYLSRETIQELATGMATDEQQFFETRHQTRDGSVFPVEISSSRISYMGSPAILSVVRDITERHRAREALEESEKRYRREKEYLDNLFDNSPDAISIVDAKGRVVRWNRQTIQLLGYEFREIEGEHFSRFYIDSGELSRMLQSLRKNGAIRGYEIELLHRDGSAIPCSLSISLLSGERGERAGSVCIIRDLREWKRAQRRLEEMSFHDSLTGLYNRAFFEEEMRRLADGRYCPVCLIIADINGLKLINDVLGHQKGDELIQTAAGILQRCFRDSDILARIGGDEFGVLLPQCSEEIVRTCRERISQELEQHNKAHPEFGLSISMGHAAVEAPPVDTHELFQRADNAMYKQKVEQSHSSRSEVAPIPDRRS